jgi:hypothetical protein
MSDDQRPLNERPHNGRPQDDENGVPELSRLRDVELSAQDRHEIWQELEDRMDRWEQQKPRRTGRRLLVSATAVAAVLAGLVVAYDQLSMFQHTTPAAEEGLQRKVVPPQTQPADRKRLVQEIMTLAKLGQVPNCPFTADQSLIDEVKQAWGEPDRQDAVGKGIYATYEKRGFTFGFNKGNQIFDVRTYAEDVRQLDLETVKKELGEPDHINEYSDETTPLQDIYVYNAGSLYELQLIFPKVTAQNPTPRLDHISVYCDSLNVR